MMIMGLVRQGEYWAAIRKCAILWKVSMMLWGYNLVYPHGHTWTTPSEVAQPTRSSRAAHNASRRTPQGYENILYQIGYFSCNPVPSEYIRRGMAPLVER
jgi:hypothetical protein